MYKFTQEQTHDKQPYLIFLQLFLCVYVCVFVYVYTVYSSEQDIYIYIYIVHKFYVKASGNIPPEHVQT